MQKEKDRAKSARLFISMTIGEEEEMLLGFKRQILVARASPSKKTT
jgi:hypothetical protein